jgi:NAD-dependent dihydropyrimidine dehydrogenase PreA subunit
MSLRYLSGVTTLEYDAQKCTGCGRCVEVCPHSVFAMENGRASLVDKDACIECGACQKNCAFDAIKVEAGVGCAAAILGSAGSKKQPSCGGGNGNCCG